MDWLISVWDQLPLLLVLSPAVGCLTTLVLARFRSDLVRQVALANMFCTVLILSGSAWRFTAENVAETIALAPTENDLAESGGLQAAREMVYRRVERHRAEYLSHQWFVISGVNLWPMIVLVVVAGVMIWHSADLVGNPKWFVPNVLCFLTMIMGAMSANEVQIFLLFYGGGVLAMSTLLGFWGGADRRTLAERFLITQFCGGSFVALGFAMLVVAVPWMKYEDSPTSPMITGNIATIHYEIHKWTETNQLAFQYGIEVFPWILLVLSFGFAILFGLFPFHASQVNILGRTPRCVASLYLAGQLSACSIGWMRFVMPIAPNLLLDWDWLILVPTVLGAIWMAIRSLSPGEPRERLACLFASISAVSLLGVYTFTRSGISSTWLMQQQMTVLICLVLLPLQSDRAKGFEEYLKPGDSWSSFSTRTSLLLLSLPGLGLFASGYILVSELFVDHLILLIPILISGSLLTMTMVSLLKQLQRNETICQLSTLSQSRSDPANGDLETSFHERGHVDIPFLVLLSLAVIANCCPGLLIHQCEQEFGRVFHRFEPAPPADSATPESNDQQKSP